MLALFSFDIAFNGKVNRKFETDLLILIDRCFIAAKRL